METEQLMKALVAGLSGYGKEITGQDTEPLFSGEKKPAEKDKEKPKDDDDGQKVADAVMESARAYADGAAGQTKAIEFDPFLPGEIDPPPQTPAPVPAPAEPPPMALAPEDGDQLREPPRSTAEGSDEYKRGSRDPYFDLGGPQYRDAEGAKHMMAQPPPPTIDVEPIPAHDEPVPFYPDAQPQGGAVPQQTTPQAAPQHQAPVMGLPAPQGAQPFPPTARPEGYGLGYGDFNLALPAGSPPPQAPAPMPAPQAPAPAQPARQVMDEPTQAWMQAAHKAITSMPGLQNFPPPPKDLGPVFVANHRAKQAALDSKIAAQRQANTAEQQKVADGLTLKRESANLLNEVGIEAEKIAADFDAQIEPELAEMRSMMQKIERAEIKDYWADKSIFRRVMAAVAMGLGAYGSNINGGPNHAAKIIEGEINRDYNRQKANIQRSIDLYKMRGTQVARLQAVYTKKMNLLNAATSARYKGIMAKVSDQMAAATTAGAKAKGDALLADLQIAKAKLDDEMVKPFVEISKHQQKKWIEKVLALWGKGAATKAASSGVLTAKQWMDANKARGLTPDGSMSAYDSVWHRTLWQNLQKRIPSRVKMTEADKKSIGYYIRMRESLKQIRRLKYKGATPKRLRDYLLDKGGLRLAANDREKAYFLAVRNYVTAVLRRDSGAAITDAEAEKYSRLYATEPGDGPETDRAKARMLQQDFEATKSAAGKAYDQWAFNAGLDTTAPDYTTGKFESVPWTKPDGATFLKKRLGASDDSPDWIMLDSEGRALMGLTDEQKVGIDYRSSIQNIGDSSYKVGGYNNYLNSFMEK